MAKTQGHGNPDWTRDETILALDLYLSLDGSMPSESDFRVVALSNLLRGLAIHAPDKRVGSFRNPNGVAFKLQNIQQVALGKGLPNVSKTDREVWTAFGGKKAEVRALALNIASLGQADGVAAAEPVVEVDADEVFFEGRLLTAYHLRRERRPKLRKALLASRAKSGQLKCDGCGYGTEPVDEQIAHAAFEAHHLVPLSLAGSSHTRLKDVAMLCATCHRLVHRWIAIKGEWLAMGRIRAIVKPGLPKAE